MTSKVFTSKGYIWVFLCLPCLYFLNIWNTVITTVSMFCSVNSNICVSSGSISMGWYSSHWKWHFPDCLWHYWAKTFLIAPPNVALNISFPSLAGEKAMATHSSTLAWRIPGTGEPGGLPSMGSHRVGHDWSNLAAAAAAAYCIAVFLSGLLYSV